ncbi:MAG: putative major facilitator superfamily transport protein YajR [Sodalis sp. Psp]|nr:putative major facilitator superfamily transport protein YajR [Sodalis sp. Psp]MCR3757045.1 putative major facilitator superfamily transport protein YajR [Sodalis sp. Ppy]
MELRATWGLGTVFSLRMLGMFMVLPVLTTYGMALQDASESLIGLAIGIYGLMQAIFQIPFGLISDYIGRKPLIIGGSLIFALGSAIAALTDSICGVILGRALQGSGAITAVVMALLADLTQEHNRTKAMSCIGVSFGITFAIAMVIGPIVTHAIGLSGLFWIITILALINVILTLLVVPSADSHTLNRESDIVRDSFGKILSNLQLLKLNLGIFCLHALLMLNFIALPPIMTHAGFPPADQWQVYLVTMLISFAAMVPIIIYAEMKRRMKGVFIGCVIQLTLVELILLAADGNLWLIFFGIQLFFLAFNVMETLLPSLISKESPAGCKGTAMGVHSTSQFLGVAFGGSLGGCLFQFQGTWLVFLVCIAIALILWLVSTTLREPPYISRLRIALTSRATADGQLVQHLRAQPGVTEVVVVPEECSAYIRVDTKQTNRAELEKIVAA